MDELYTVDQERNLTGSGQYIIIASTDLRFEAKQLYAYVRRDLTTFDWSTLRGYFFIAVPKPLPEVAKALSEKVVHYGAQPPFPPYEQRLRLWVLQKNSYTLHVSCVYLYDATMVYFKAVNSLLAKGLDIRNGTLIYNEIRNSTFQSVLGPDVYIDMNGNAEGNFTVYHVVERYEGIQGNATKNFTIERIANFQSTQKSSNEENIPELVLLDGVSIPWINKEPPLSEPPCGFDNSKCVSTSFWWILPMTIPPIILFGLSAVFIIKQYRYRQKLANLLWKVDYRDIVFCSPPAIQKQQPQQEQLSRNLLWGDEHSSLFSTLACSPPPNTNGNLAPAAARPSLFKGSFGSPGTVTYGAPASGNNTADGFTAISHSLESDFSRRSASDSCEVPIACYRGSVVAVKFIERKHVEVTSAMREELLLLKETIHENLHRVVGVCVDAPKICILSLYMPRGSLRDLLKNTDIYLDHSFIACLVNDILKGLTYLHESYFIYHGNLKPTKCLLDSHWTVQISGFGLRHFRYGGNMVAKDCDEFYSKLLWKSPEHLKLACPRLRGSQKEDVYSFAFILYELFGRRGPWGRLHDQMSAKEIIESVKQSPNFRPPLLEHFSEHQYLKDCVSQCWAETPEKRPDFKQVRFLLKTLLSGLGSNGFDNMLLVMDRYSKNLEAIVERRTQELSAEKKKIENLLLRMLPKTVTEQLKCGQQVVPERYDSVSIYFSDIVGFTTICADSDPMQVVQLLNSLYTRFDSIIGEYDVYKVETIGDAYMVVSGLPKRNGDLHAGEIASMSLHLLSAIQSFVIPHRPDETLKLRIGIHSGPCVAGVVGLKMPRYTLFGDTVNTASRMESTGVELKIHVSQECKKLLDLLGGYVLEERGTIPVKGKGAMTTYFLMQGDPNYRHVRLQRKLEQEMQAHHHRHCCHGQDFPCDSDTVDVYSQVSIESILPSSEVQPVERAAETSYETQIRSHSVAEPHSHGVNDLHMNFQQLVNGHGLFDKERPLHQRACSHHSPLPLHNYRPVFMGDAGSLHGINFASTDDPLALLLEGQISTKHLQESLASAVRPRAPLLRQRSSQYQQNKIHQAPSVHRNRLSTDESALNRMMTNSVGSPQTHSPLGQDSLIHQSFNEEPASRMSMSPSIESPHQDSSIVLQPLRHSSDTPEWNFNIV